MSIRRRAVALVDVSGALQSHGGSRPVSFVTTFVSPPLRPSAAVAAAAASPTRRAGATAAAAAVTLTPPATAATTATQPRRFRAAKNNEDRVFYVDLQTGAKTWDVPPNAIVEIPSDVEGPVARAANRFYHYIAESTGAAVALGGVMMAGLAAMAWFG